MAQANPFDQFDQTTSAPTPGPVFGAPPKPEKPDAPKTTWRQGVVNGKPVQISSEGKVEALPGDAGGNPNSLDPKTIEGQRNIATGILKNTGVNLQTGDDPVSELILNSTSGWLQTRGAEVYGGLTGDATSGMEAIGKLKPMLADMTLQMTGGSLGSQISDGDRKFIMERMGNIADPEVPADQRLASWEEVKRRLAQMSGIEMPAQMEQGEEGLSGSVTDDSPMAPTGNNAPPSGGNGGGGSFWQGIGAGVGDLVEAGVNNTVGLIVNPINTVAGRAMGYEGYTSDIGQTIRDALQLPEGNQTVSAINQAAAGGLSVGGLSRKAGQVLGNASLRAFGNNPLLDAATGATAAASGEVARQSGAGPVGQSVATLAGGFAPSAAIGGRNALLGVMGRNPPRGPAPDMAVIEAGQRQGVPIRQPDARPKLRGDYAALESTERAGPMIAAARTKDAEAIATRANEVTGGNAFDRADNTALGQAVQKTAERAEADVKGVANTLYQRAEREAPDFVTPSTQTSAFIDSKIAELKAASPTGYNAEISALEAMKSDLAQTGLSVRTLQAQRETVGGRIGDNMQDRSRADRTFTEVLKVAGEELHSALRSANPRAAEILKRADAKWGQYKRLQKEVTGLFLGKRGDATAETAARNLNATTRNNYSALRRFMTMATPEEKADFAATFVQNWGATARGDFSPAIYAKNMENVSDRTLDALVGTEGRKALRDLQVISNAKTDAMGRMAPSGKAISGMKGGLRTLMLSTLGLSQGGIGGAVLLPAAANLFAKIGEERAARLMLNPDFTKWLRAMPEATNPKAINAYFGKLKASAARSQVAANDVEAFTAAVMEAFAQSPRRAAAQEEDN